jgi:2-octaprenyl-6-methoxyphenol hydroxylase
MSSHDAIVVGGGLTGAAAAITLAQAGLDVVHLAPEGLADRRTSALMQPSVDFLLSSAMIEQPDLLGHKLTQIRIIDATQRLIRAPETLFDAREAGLDAFGWNFANAGLLEQFKSIAATLPNLSAHDLMVSAIVVDENGHRLELSDGSTLSGRLLVGADGKNSSVRAAAGIPVREQKFTQAALVCDLELFRPLGTTSIEFHYQEGPFTLVPAGGNRANLVWIDQLPVLEAAKASAEPAFAATLLQRSQRLFGAIRPVTPAFVFPLSTLTVNIAGSRGVVLVGEAAHAFPPIGAQGLNLGLRDVAELASALEGTNRIAPNWASSVSTQYAALRAGDLARTGTMVDALFRSLLADMLPVQAMRAGGLWALKLMPELRRRAFTLGMGQR